MFLLFISFCIVFFTFFVELRCKANFIMEKKDEYLSKVETKEGNFYLFVQKISQGSEGMFDLHITDGCGTWSVKVDEELLKEMASKVEMDTKDYISETLAALTCQHSANNCFVYQVTENDASLEFSWKKVLDDGVRYQLGSISLPSENENKVLMQRILNFSISKIQDYKNNISSMKTEIEQLSKDRSNTLLRLEKCVTSKEEMELDLFQKFVAVLNEKKAKIRRLQEAIEKQSKEESTKNNDLSLPNDDKGDKLNTNRDDDTDDESRCSKQEIEKQKADMSSNISSCLFNDEEDTAPVVKRRRRKQNTKANVTPSKPVLPEVKPPVKRTVSNASTDSAASSESKQSNKGSRSSSRKKKEPSTFPDDVEDLFGDMA